MPPRTYLIAIFLSSLVATFSPSAMAKNQPDADQLISQCEQANGQNRFKLHHCLLAQFERLQKTTDQLTDHMLSLVGGHRSFGRLRIIQWSNAITKSQLRWQKLVPWDCEWEGHILTSNKGAAVAIDRCGVKRAAKRVILLEKRLQTLNTILDRDQQQDK